MLVVAWQSVGGDVDRYGRGRSSFLQGPRHIGILQTIWQAPSFICRHGRTCIRVCLASRRVDGLSWHVWSWRAWRNQPGRPCALHERAMGKSARVLANTVAARGPSCSCKLTGHQL
jgi:hypothetical protein